MTEQTIFLSALDVPKGDKRAAFLDSACAGDPALRRQVEALLDAHERSGAFLNDPAVEQIAAGRPGSEADTTELESGTEGGWVGSLGFLQPGGRAGSLGRLAHYEVLEVLGRGGFGTVLRAFDDRLHRVVAIKVLAPHLASSGTARARFIREARSGAAVRDEHVVSIHEVSEEHEPVPFLVMEYVAGQTLQQKLDRTGPLPVHEILRIGHQVASGLAAAHATGLVHRDVKPSNILLENGVERVKLTDFGLARAADDASVSQSGVVAGTPMFMAPEQAHGGPIDDRADLFSLGSVLYAMCAGRPPFRASTAMAVLNRVCEEDPRPVRDVNPEIPQWLGDLVAKLQAKRPEDRLQSAREVADMLGKFLAELQMHGGVATPPAMPAASRRSRWRWPAIAAIILIAASALTCVPAVRPVIDGIRGDGRLVIRVDDPEVVVDVSGQGRVEGVGDHSMRLRAGRYSIQAAKDAAGRRLTKQWDVDVERGGQAVVEVKASELIANPGSGLAPDKPPMPPSPEDERVRKLLGDALLLMPFDKEDFYKQDDHTWVRDRSGYGNDGVCEKVEPVGWGNAGGGLLCRAGGQVRLSKSLLNRLPAYTITAWIRPDSRKPARQRLYHTTDLNNRLEPVYAVYLLSDLGVRVEAFNDHFKPNTRLGASGGQALRWGVWNFVTVVFNSGKTGKGGMEVSVDGLASGSESHMVDSSNAELVDRLGQNLEGVLDEVAVFARALPPEDIELLRKFGLAGKSFSALRPGPVIKK